MGYHNDLINIVSILEQVAESQNYSGCFFDLMLIARSIFYSAAYSSGKKYVGCDYLENIVLSLQKKHEEPRLRQYFFFAHPKCEITLSKFKLLVEDMLLLLTDVTYKGSILFKDEASFVLQLLGSILNWLQPNKSVLQYALYGDAVLLLDCYKQLFNCEAKVLRFSNKLIKRKKPIPAAIFKNSYFQFKKADRLSTTKKIIDNMENAINKTSEKKKYNKFIGFFRNLVLRIKRKLGWSEVKAVKSMTTPFFSRIKHTALPPAKISDKVMIKRLSAT